MRSLSWSIDTETAGLAVLVGGTAASFLSGVNPSFFTMRAFVSDGDDQKACNTRKDIRIGSTIGAGLALATGYGASLVSGSWWPLIAAMVVLATIIGAYEHALRNPHGYGSIEGQ